MHSLSIIKLIAPQSKILEAVQGACIHQVFSSSTIFSTNSGEIYAQTATQVRAV
jgi:hypothetical protein